MAIGIFLKALVIYIASALIIYAVSPYSLDFLLKLLAFAFGAALLTPFAYPHLRGVRKGDSVLVEVSGREAAPGILRLFFQAGSGVAVENGRIGGKIMVAMADGSMKQCAVLGYSGFFTPARVRMVKPGEVSPTEITVV